MGVRTNIRGFSAGRTAPRGTRVTAAPLNHGASRQRFHDASRHSGQVNNLSNSSDPDGLAQVALDPGLPRELATGMFATSCQGNQSQVLKPWMLREMSGDVVTAHVRQIEIHEQHRRLELNGESRSSCARVRDARSAVSRRLQQ
jgi:hypothetical protein